MFTSAKPHGPWCGAVRRHASAGTATPTQRLADAGAPPPRASREMLPQPARKDAIAASCADTRKLMLRSAEKRRPAEASSTGSAMREVGCRATAAAEAVQAQEGTAATAAVSSIEQKCDRSEEVRPGSFSTGLRKGTAAQRKRRWALLHRASKRRYGKRRSDLPRCGKSTGRAEGLDNPLRDSTAIAELRGGVYSETARKSTEARIAWWKARAMRRGMAPFPLTKEALTLAGALLKQGAYRSAPQYLYSIKKHHLAVGGAWDAEMATLFKDVKRSCERGRGGSRQADAVPLDESGEPYRGTRLAQAEACLIVGSWWMLREIELANVVQKDLEFKPGGGCGVATLRVSASKRDWRAKGVKRHHGCACPSRWCPVLSAKALWEAAKGDSEAPLVLTVGGQAASKQAVCEEIRGWAAHRGATAGNFTGHSLRTTGAQRLARAGVSEAKIRMFGRWASHAMLGYVREALLAEEGVTVAKQVIEQEVGRASSERGGRACEAGNSTTARKWKQLKASQEHA